MKFVFNPFTNNLDIAEAGGSGGSGVNSLTGNSGGAVPADGSDNINVVGSNVTGINIVGNPGTNTLTASGIASSSTQVGTTRFATNAETAAQASATVALTPGSIIHMFENNPLPTNQGGTGDMSFTSYAPICGGTSGSGPLQSADTGISTSGYVLTSTGATSLPTWQAGGGGGGGIVTIDDDFSGSATGSTVTFDANTNCGSSVSFQAAGAAVDLMVTDTNNNTIMGLSAGTSTSVNGSANTGFGNFALGSLSGSLTTGNTNTAVGYAALFGCIGGNANTAVGSLTMEACIGNSNTGIGTNSLTTLSSGDSNNALGNNSLSGISTGSYNISIGDTSSGNYGSSESSNIILNSAGVTSESNTLRIGAGTGSSAQQLNQAFISGVQGVVVTGAPVAVSSSDQIGIYDTSSMGYVLTSDGSGGASFQAAGGGGSYYSLTPYIVGSDSHSQYSTIQAAINQAVTDGASNTNLLNIYIKPGTYTEDLTLSDGICLIGFTPNIFFRALTQEFSIFPNSSVILDGTITSGGSGAANNYITGISVQRTASGNAINFASTGNLFLKDFSVILYQGTIFTITFVDDGTSGNIICDNCNFLNDKTSENAVQFYSCTAVTVGMFFNNTNVFLGVNEVTSTITQEFGNGGNPNIRAMNSVLAYSQVAETNSSVTCEARYSLIQGVNAPFITTNADSTPSSSYLALYFCEGFGLFTDSTSSNTAKMEFSNTDNTFTGLLSVSQNIASINEHAFISGPGAGSATSSLSLGSNYQNPFGYDVMLTVYINVTVSTGGSILSGVGPTSSPTQQTIYNGLSVTGIVPVSIYLPTNYYALISTSGTITASITGQQATPV